MTFIGTRLKGAIELDSDAPAAQIIQIVEDLDTADDQKPPKADKKSKPPLQGQRR